MLNYSLSMIEIKEVFSGKSKCVFCCFFLLLLFPFNLISVTFTDYTLPLFYHLTEEKQGTNVAPLYNYKCKMSACACTCCQKEKERAAIIMKNVALPVPSSSFLFRLALSWHWRNYSSLQQMKNKSVVNNWYCLICSVWLFIYQHIWCFSCSSLLYSRLETKAGRVVYFIL